MRKVWAVAVLAASALVLSPLRSAPATASESFIETFDGSPGSPYAWNPDNWDVTVHSRDSWTFDTLETVQAGHGADCAGPPATHPVNQYADATFICKDHLMTALKAEGYGAIYLTPDRLVDFGSGATISLDVSTQRTSLRDWWDIWITPFDEQLQAPLEDFYPDLDGPPKDAIHILMSNYNGGTVFKAEVYRNFQAEAIDGNWWTTYESAFATSPSRRDTFRLDLSPTHLTFGMPADANDGFPKSNLTWIDSAIAKLGWTKGIVQFGHHSYNPEKDAGCGNVCQANTWHWDNVKISPAVPYTIVRSSTRSVNGPSPQTMTLRSPAPSGGHLRFLGIGNGLQVSYDGGATWTAAVAQQQLRTTEDHFVNYWMPAPAGATSVMFRGSSWYGGNWYVRDVSVVADNGIASPNSTPPVPNAISPTPGTNNQFTPVPPARLLDTRPGGSTADGVASGGGVVSPGSVSTVQVTNRAGVPSGAAAVVLTVTAANSASPGYVTAYACGTTRPTASNLNFGTGQTRANTVVTQLGPDGTVCLYTGDGSTQLLVDVTGFLPASSAFQPLTPARLLDTRPGGSTTDGRSLGAGSAAPGTTTTVEVAGRGGVPAGAKAVVLTVTSADPTTPGYLTVYPCDAQAPNASNVNFPTGGAIANTVVTGLSSAGTICIFNGDGATQLLADVTGYFTTGSTYTTTAPSRLLDTRPGAATIDGRFTGTGPVPAGITTQVLVNGRAGVPADAAAAVLTITAVDARQPGYLTVYPCGLDRPTASNVNYAVGTTIANTVLSQVGTNGMVCVYTGDGATGLIVDVAGYLPTTSAGVTAAGFTSTAYSAADEYCELPRPALTA